jgi:hypothetical protein
VRGSAGAAAVSNEEGSRSQGRGETRWLVRPGSPRGEPGPFIAPAFKSVARFIADSSWIHRLQLWWWPGRVPAGNSPYPPAPPRPLPPRASLGVPEIVRSMLPRSVAPTRRPASSAKPLSSSAPANKRPSSLATTAVVPELQQRVEDEGAFPRRGEQRPPHEPQSFLGRVAVHTLLGPGGGRDAPDGGDLGG